MHAAGVSPLGPTSGGVKAKRRWVSAEAPDIIAVIPPAIRPSTVGSLRLKVRTSPANLTLRAQGLLIEDVMYCLFDVGIDIGLTLEGGVVEERLRRCFSRAVLDKKRIIRVS